MARILVIDDDDYSRRLVCEVLARAGHEALGTADGRAGISRYRDSPTDVIIIDIFMPDYDGLEAICELRHQFARAKIIAISGGGQVSNLDVLPIAEKLGAHRTLGKPFGTRELLNAVSELLEERIEART